MATKIFQKATAQQFGRKHPLVNQESHDKLLQYVLDRIRYGRYVRDSMKDRFTNIDKDMAAFVKLDEKDKKRARDNRAGRGPKVTQVDIPLAAAKIDEMLTYLMTVFFPQDGMYAAYSNYKQQPVANGLAILLNTNAKRRGHYRKCAKFLYDALKYNYAAMLIEWKEDKGAKLERDLAGGGMSVRKDQVVSRGNELINIDMYNFIADPSVHPVDLPTKGEFVATVKMLSKYTAKKLAAAGQFWNADVWLENVPTARYEFWVEPPTLRYDISVTNGQNDWFKFALGDQYSTIGGGIELVSIYISLNPFDFGLTEEKELQIWRVDIINGQHIVAAEYMNNAHEELPVVVAVPSEDMMGMQMRSPAETLTDLQRFCSFLLNIHQSASRKALWGLTVYNPNVVDMSGHEDDVAGLVSMKTNSLNTSVNDAVKQFIDAPKTDGTMTTIQHVLDLMETILPTNQLKQVADLQRATQFQAAATVQAADRRHFKLAKLIDDQAFSRLRRQEVYNLTQYQPTVEIVGPGGQPITVNPAEFDQNTLEETIGSGLQNMDKMTYMSYMQNLLNSLLQSPQASQQLDILGLINYMSNLAGDKTDLTQFRLQPQQPMQQPVQDPDAAQEQAEGKPSTAEEEQEMKQYASQMQAVQNLQRMKIGG